MLQENISESCLICLKPNKIMISAYEIMTGYEEYTIAELLRDLNFLPILDAVNLPKKLCFVCVSKIQYCYDFKSICRQNEDTLKQLENNACLQTIMQPNGIKSENWSTSTVEPIHSESVTIFELNNVNIFKDSEITNLNSNENFDRNIILKTEIEDLDDYPDNSMLEEKYNTENPLSISFEDSSNITENGENNSNEMIEMRGSATNCKSNVKISIENYQEVSSAESSSPYNAEKHCICETCGKVFADEDTLNEHKNVHSNTNHVCPYCRKSFTSKQLWRAHVLKEEKVYIYSTPITRVKRLEKLKRKSLGLDEKIRILDKLKSGVKVAAIANEFNLRDSTIRTILQNEKKIRAVMSSASSLSSNRVVRIRNMLMPKMEKNLIMWIMDCHLKNVPLNNLTIKQKAIEIFQNLKNSESVSSKESQKYEFKASTGWFDRFKKRFCLENVKMVEESTATKKKLLQD